MAVSLRGLLKSVLQWETESSLAGRWLADKGGDGECAARTGSGPMRMRLFFCFCKNK